VSRGLSFSHVFSTFAEWFSSRSGHSAYAARIARAHARYPTATLAQLRRHPSAGATPLSRVRRAPPFRIPFGYLSQKERLQRQRALGVLSRARRGKGSLSKLARAEGISSPTVRRATGAFRKRGGRWVATRHDRIQRWLQSHENGHRISVLIDDSRTATRLSQYAHAVNEYLLDRDTAVLRPFKGETYRDAFGAEHTFETDPDALIAAAERVEDDFAAFADLYSESASEEVAEA
jgi:hypothetical protein